MAKIIGLPKLSPTMEEGTLVRWAKNEGDSVEIDDLLAEVETDKATMEFRSFDRGVLLKVLVQEGETVEQDAPVAIIGKAGEDIAELLGQVGAKGAGPSAGPDVGRKEKEREAAAALEKTEIPSEQPIPDPTSVRAASPAQTRVAYSDGTEEGAERRDGRVRASPLVRKLAREHEVDLAAVDGTGPGGRVIKRDLEGYLREGPRPSAPTVRGEARVEKASQMRKTIARRLTESKRDVPHYYLTIDIDAEPLLAARAQINETLAATGEKISVNDLIIKTCGVALRRHPEVNVSWIDGEIHRHANVDVSMAVAIPDGLITPVIRDADRKGVAEIAREARELAGRAREKKLKPEEFTGGTFSVSNLGMFGIEEFSAVINPPEGAILAVGTVREEPVVKAGQIVPGKRMRMTLSCDHRVIDGATGAAWLKHLKSYLESPVTLIV